MALSLTTRMRGPGVEVDCKNLSIFNLSRDSRLLAVLAHPDDEIGIAGWLYRLHEAGIPIRLVWAHSNPIREVESRNAMRLIGPSDLHFLGLPDGDLVDHLSELVETIREHHQEFSPTDVVTMHFEQGHLDHDACSFSVAQATPVRRWEFPMYHTYLTRFQTLGTFSVPLGEKVLELSPEERFLKQRLTETFPSQTLRRNILAFQIMRALTFRPVRMGDTERYKVDPQHDYLVPNHPAPLALRVSRSRHWSRWEAAVRAFGYASKVS